MSNYQVPRLWGILFCAICVTAVPGCLFKKKAEPVPTVTASPSPSPDPSPSPSPTPDPTTVGITGTFEYGVAAQDAAVNGMKIDGHGNIYVVGTTTGNLVTGTGAATGALDAFVAKYNRLGTRQWIHQLGYGSVGTGGVGIGLDGSGNVYIGGSTGADLPAGTGYTSAAAAYYIAKYDNDGTLLWIREAGVTFKNADAYALAVDSAGTTTLVGGTDTNLSAGSGNSTGSNDVFVVQYNASGTRQWVAQMGVASYYSAAKGVAVGAGGHVGVTGITTANLSSGSGAATGAHDFFIASFDATGTRQWITQTGVTSKSIDVAALTSDLSGSFYATGTTSTNFSAGSGSSTGVQDLFVVKYDGTGGRTWVAQKGQSGGDSYGDGITLDSAGGVLVSGHTDSDFDVGSGSTLGVIESFALQLSFAGTMGWLKLSGVSGDVTEGSCVATDSSNNLLIGGYTTGNLVTGAGPSTGSSDLFVKGYTASGMAL